MSQYFRAIILLGIILLAAQAVADPPQPPQFEANHIRLKTSYCNLVTYKFEAKIVDPPPGSDHPIRYHLISGPGVLDSKTGEWYYQPSKEDVQRSLTVEVAASIGGNPHCITSGLDNAFLSIGVRDFLPRLSLENYPPFSVINVTDIGEHIFNINIVDLDTCEIHQFYIDSIYPQPQGNIEIVEDQLFIDIAPEDLGKKFYFEIYFEGYKRSPIAWYVVDTRSDITVDFVICPDTINITPCEYNSFEIKATDHYEDSSFYHSLGLRYEIVSGPGSISAGSGYYYFSPEPGQYGQTFEVEVKATYMGYETSENCHFFVTVGDLAPGIILSNNYSCGDTAVVRNPEYGFTLEIRGVGEYDCTPQPVEISNIEGDVNGVIKLDSTLYSGPYAYLVYSPDPVDVGKVFKVTFHLIADGDSIYCDLYLKNDWETPKPKSFQVRIDQVNNAQAGSHVIVPVYLDSASHGIGGFDLLLTYNNQALSFQQSMAGSLFDSEDGCDWEYFTYRLQQTLPDSITRVIRFVGIAETNNGPDHPTCFLPDESSPVLFNLDFMVTNDRTFECTYLPLKFIWFECSDNCLSSIDGTEIYVSDSVYYITEDSYGNPPHLENITDPNTGFPTYTGFQPAECGESIREQFQVVDFINGGVQVICSTPIDTSLTGDVNLNGVAFEIADLVLFTNYFPYGPGVFGDTQTVSSRTDVNLDGNNLTVADWVYFRNIVIGDAIDDLDYLYDTLTAEISYNKEQHLLQAHTDMQYGALYLVVDTIVTPQLQAQNMDMMYCSNMNEGITRIFVFSYEDESFGPGQILGGLNGDIVNLEVADSDGRAIITPMNFVMGVNDNLNLLPNQFGLAQNYPNPFNNATVISFSLPSAQEVEFEIFNILGKKVHSERRRYETGIHQIYWERNIASGIYYYRLKAGDKIATRKMILLK